MWAVLSQTPCHWSSGDLVASGNTLRKQTVLHTACIRGRKTQHRYKWIPRLDFSPSYRSVSSSVTTTASADYAGDMNSSIADENLPAYALGLRDETLSETQAI